MANDETPEQQTIAQEQRPSIKEEQIIQLLETTPVPLSRYFHNRMAAMPWMVDKKRGNKQMNHSILTNRTKQLVFGLALLSVITLLLTIVTPMGRAFAQDILRFFQRSHEIPPVTLTESEPIVVNIQSEPGQIEVAEEKQVIVETAVSSDNYALAISSEENEPVVVEIESETGRATLVDDDGQLDMTISETENGFSASAIAAGAGGGGGIATNNIDLSQAADEVGYPVSTITALPEGYRLVTVFTPLADINVPAGTPGPTFITQYFEDGIHTIMLTQDSKLKADGNVGTTIGENAVTQEVELAPGITAEYVKGIWVFPEEVTPGTDPMATAVWDNNAPDQALVWEANGIRYELKSNSPSLTLSALVQIAQSIK